jgi:hypothetical protein|tara:strand:+ start:832 stop:1479 length:648 start_codon:yes stop_codon:yes gene_type:complete
MAIKINVNKSTDIDIKTNAEKDRENVTVDVTKDLGINIKPTIGIKINDNKKTIKKKLNFKKAINGDIMIFGHGDIDIMVLKEQKKIVAFAKQSLNDRVYGAENRLFEFLTHKGIVQYDSIQGGNIYGSMEAKILAPEKKIKQLIVLTVDMINEWIQSEKPIFNSLNSYDDMMNDLILDPDDEHATELGEVPHEEEKGSILTKNLFAPYLYGRYSY